MPGPHCDGSTKKAGREQTSWTTVAMTGYFSASTHILTEARVLGLAYFGHLHILPLSLPYFPIHIFDIQ